MLNLGQILGIVAGSLVGAIILGETGFGFYCGFSGSKKDRAKGRIKQQIISERSRELWKTRWKKAPLSAIFFAPFWSGGNLGMIAEHYSAK